MRIAIVDDDKNYSSELKSHLERYSKEYDLGLKIDVYDSGLELIFDYKPVYDVLLLDIQMPDLDGMELAKTIRTTDQRTIILFVTNTPHFAVKGYTVDAFDYIVKPVAYETFKIKFKLALDSIKRDSFQIMVSHENEDVFVNTDDIILIEVHDHWLSIHTNTTSYEMLGTLKEMEKQLKNCYFIRCNKSTLINIRHIISIKSDTIQLTKKNKVITSRNRKKNVQSAFMDFHMNEV